MNRNRSYQIFTFFMLMGFFILQGCIDEPVNIEGTVEGTVYDQYGMYNPYALISVGDYPIVSTDNYGHFKIENSTYPYNLTIANQYYSYTQKFLGINLPVSQIYNINSYGTSNTSYLTVKFPALTFEFDRAIIKFISNDINLQFGDNIFMDSIRNIEIYFMNDKDRVEGKLIFLQYTYYDDIVSFDKFGMKDVILDRGSKTITFTPGDVIYNPKELYANFNLQISNFNNWNSSIEMNFQGMHQNSAIRLRSHFSNLYSSYFIVPELPMLNYNVKFTNYAYPDDSAYFHLSQKWVYVQPGEDISLTHNKSLDLEFPVDGETHVNDDTKFTFTDHEPGGTYIYRFSTDELQNNSLDIVTDKYPLELRDFKTWNYQFKPNKIYYWGVLKYPGYKNINDFASSNVLDDSLNSEIPASELFTFKIQQ